MSLAKLPLLLLYPFFWRIVFTPPQPPAPKEERYDSTTLDRPGSYNWRMRIVHIGVDVTSLLEGLSIIAINYSSLPMSQFILRNMFMVLPQGKPVNFSLNWISLVGFILVAFGAFVRFMSYRSLGQFFRFEPSMQKDHQLITTGPYSLVRHPGYTGATAAVLGWVMWAIAPGSWSRESGVLASIPAAVFFGIWIVRFNLIIPFILIPRVPIEDSELRKRFGQEWDEWAERVPYALIPGVY